MKFLKLIIFLTCIFLLASCSDFNNIKVPVINILKTSNIEKDILFYELEKYLKENNYNLSIGYYDIKDNYTYTYNADKLYYGASLIKTLDALYVYEKMDITDDLKNNVKLAIEKSDNKAHQLLVKTIGFNNLKNYGLSLGMNKVLTNGNELYGYTNILDQLIMWRKLYYYINDINIDNTKREELKNYFINNYYNYLKFNNSPIIMHKYGYYDKFFHDVGIVFANHPYIVVVLTKEAKNKFSIVTDVSRRIYEINKKITWLE